MISSVDATLIIFVVLILSSLLIFSVCSSCRWIIQLKNREIAILQKENDYLREMLDTNKSRIEVKNETIAVLQEVVDHLNPENIH